jgi:predicted nucleotidyltransferase
MVIGVAHEVDPVTPDEIDRIAQIVSPFANEIDAVDVFGSRATGTARHGSDLDLILCGPITLYSMLKLGVAFDESDLAFKIDLLHERDLTDPAVRQQILGQARPLLSRDALRVMARQ